MFFIALSVIIDMITAKKHNKKYLPGLTGWPSWALMMAGLITETLGLAASITTYMAA